MNDISDLPSDRRRDVGDRRPRPARTRHSAASSRTSGRSSSCITTSTCRCRRSPRRWGSRSARPSRACTAASARCERRSTPTLDRRPTSVKDARHEPHRRLRPDSSPTGSTRTPSTACPTTSMRSCAGPARSDSGRHGRASKGGSPCRRRFASRPAPRIAWLLVVLALIVALAAAALCRRIAPSGCRRRSASRATAPIVSATTATSCRSIPPPARPTPAHRWAPTRTSRPDFSRDGHADRLPPRSRHGTPTSMARSRRERGRRQRPRC